MPKLIKINTDHYVVVDDSEIKEGDHYINIEPGNPFFGKIYKGMDRILKEGYSGNGYKNPDYFKTWMKKITHSTIPLESVTNYRVFDKIKNFDKIKELSLQEVKELIGEVDVNKRVDDYGFQVPYDGSNKFYDEEKMKHYKEGYLQCLEDNKEKKYTEGDLQKAFESGWSSREPEHDGGWKSTMIFEEYVKSLQPKTEWEIEIVDGKLKLI